MKYKNQWLKLALAFLYNIYVLRRDLKVGPVNWLLSEECKECSQVVYRVTKISLEELFSHSSEH